MPIGSLPLVSQINTDSVPRKEKHQDSFSSTATYADQQVRHKTQRGAEVQKHREPLVKIIKPYIGIRSVGLSPDGKLLAFVKYDGTVGLWDLTTATEVQQILFKGYLDGITCVAFSPDGKMLASGSHDGTVRLWDLTTAALHNLLQGHSSSVICVAFSLDGKLLASGSDDGTVRLWDLTTATTVALREPPLASP